MSLGGRAGGRGRGRGKANKEVRDDIDRLIGEQVQPVRGAMDRFMKEHFADFRPIAIIFFPDKTGKPSLNGFVEVCAPSQIRIILEAVKDRSLKLSEHAGVKIKGALTDIDRARNWALATAEEQIQSCPNAHGTVVKIEKDRSKGEKAVIRGVYVNDALAYSQAERFSKTGFFVGEYAHLKLP